MKIGRTELKFGRQKHKVERPADMNTGLHFSRKKNDIRISGRMSF